MPTLTQTPVSIRQANLEDLDRCLRLDASYQSQEVWQMYIDPGAGPTGVAVRFRATRLPRAMTVPYPRDEKELRGNWQQQDCFLVATVEEPYWNEEAQATTIGERVVGYIDIHEQRWQRAGWVQNFVVDAPFRHQGIGKSLLRAAAAWAREESLRRLILEAPTKNGPALRFFHARGAEFCGFNDRYYTNSDIAVFFEYRL